jgi:hypothetical protein
MQAIMAQLVSTWRFDDGTFDATAVSFDNPDFVEVVVHS